MSFEADIWQPDPDPWVAPLETALTALGAGYLHRVHAEFHQTLALPALSGADVRATYRTPLLAKAEGWSGSTTHAGWNRAERLFRKLQGYGSRRIPPAQYVDLADAITEKWQLEGRLETKAQRLAVAQHLVGEMRAGRQPTAPPHGDGVSPLEPTPSSVTAPHERQAEFAAASAAEHLTHLAAQTRHALKQAVFQAERDGQPPAQLAQALMERFGTLNRDWRRVALTETARNRANGHLAGCKPADPAQRGAGDRVQWSATSDACPACRHHHGRDYAVVAPETPGRDPATQVWVGKAPPPPGTDAKGWPVIPLHPHCRCRWVKQLERPDVRVSPAIEDMVQALLKKARGPA